jgi:hypothetical protein
MSRGILSPGLVPEQVGEAAAAYLTAILTRP